MEVQTLFYFLIDMAAGEIDRDADGVLDRVGIGSAVADDAHALDSEQRGAAELRIVYSLLEFGVRRS